MSFIKTHTVFPIPYRIREICTYYKNYNWVKHFIFLLKARFCLPKL